MLYTTYIYIKFSEYRRIYNSVISDLGISSLESDYSYNFGESNIEELLNAVITVLELLVSGN